MESNVANPQTLTTKVVDSKIFVYKQGTTSLNRIMEFADPAINALMQEIQQKGLEPTGPLEFHYYGASADLDKEFTLQIAQPVREQKEVGSGFQFKKSSPFSCLSHDFVGDVSKMFPTYEWMYEQLFAMQLNPADEVREVYKQWEHPSSPNNITEIQIGIK